MPCFLGSMLASVSSIINTLVVCVCRGHKQLWTGGGKGEERIGGRGRKGADGVFPFWKLAQSKKEAAEEIRYMQKRGGKGLVYVYRYDDQQLGHSSVTC